MIEMVKRLGVEEAEAKRRIIMNDLVRYEKSSYKFSLEPVLNLFQSNLEEIKKASSAEGGVTAGASEVYRKTLGGKVVEADPSGNVEVDKYIRELGEQKMPDAMADASKFLSKIEKMPEIEADKLCRLVVPNYMNADKTARQYTKIEAYGQEIQFYPFSLYGADGVVVTVNGRRVENPLEEVKKIYRGVIVPSMMHSLREGD
jgi:hypothetical protein